MKTFICAILILFHFNKELMGIVASSTTQLECSGYCTSDRNNCTDKGGRIVGYCTKSLACCDPLIISAANCGDVKMGQKVVDFKSPSFPRFSSGDLNCFVKVELMEDAVGVRVDFILAEMDGIAFSESENKPGSCESDLILLRGFGNWAPQARCGNLSGYSFLVDAVSPLFSLSLVALMPSPSYRWHIRIVQFSHSELGFKSLINKEKRSYYTNPENDLHADASSSVFENEIKTKIAKRVLNGHDSIISDFPWQVSLRYKMEAVLNPSESFAEADFMGQIKSNCSVNEGVHFCGGSIIGERYILSASHCFYGTSKTSGMVYLPHVKAVVGDTNLCTDDSQNPALQSIDYDIESVTMHYAYDSQLLINDIAVIKLQSRIRYSDHIKPIIMANVGDDFSEMEAILSGWGDFIRVKNSTKEEDEAEGSTTEAVINYTSSPNSVLYSTSTTTESPTSIPSTQIPDIQSMSSTQVPNYMLTEASVNNSTFSSLNSTETVPEINVTSKTIVENLHQIFSLESPQILQSSKRFVIQNKSVCNAKDTEQYSVTKEHVLRYPKYKFMFMSTLCTLSKQDEDPPASSGKGDSGGPLIVYKQQRNPYFEEKKTSVPILVGVVSYGISEDDSDCELTNKKDGESQEKKDNRSFDYFASVAFYRKWIDLCILSYENYPTLQ